MILPYQEILAAIRLGELAIDPLDTSAIGPSSVDLHLAASLRTYSPDAVVRLGEQLPEGSAMKWHELDGEGYLLEPGGFVLACTEERVRVGHSLQGFLDTKGNVARAGLQVHNTDGHVDPGSDHVLTLEITNNNN